MRDIPYFQMYTTYIIQSEKNSKFYIGFTENIIERLDCHNRGSNRSTKSGRPWRLVYSEKFGSKREAMRREKEIKSYKGGIAFKNLISTCIQSGGVA